MAETYAQRKAAIIGAIRRVRQQYRKADSLGEVLERELDRLMLRKTIITPSTLQGLSQKYDAFMTAASATEKPITDAMTLSSSYA